MKETLEVFEKLLIVMTMVGSIIAGVYKGYEYLSAQSSIVQAKASQEQETAKAQQLLTETYAELLKKLDDDIRDIDQKLENEDYTATVGWERLSRIRGMKVKDRNQLLTSLGGEIVKMKASMESSTKKSISDDGKS